MAQKRKAKRLFSRRDFLKGVPLGIAGAIVFTVLSGRLLGSGASRRSGPPVYSKGSIFNPKGNDRART